MDFTNISFPGLGIEAFKVKNLVFKLGALEVNWSLFIFLAGVVVAFFYAACRGKKKEGISMLRTLLIAAVGVVIGLIFARAGYLLTSNTSVFRLTVAEAFSFWKGLSYPAGLFGFMIGVLIMGDVLKLRGLRLLDMFVGGALLLQIFMAVGTFMEAELIGPVIGDTTKYYLFNMTLEFKSGEGTLFHLLSMGLDKGGAIFSYHPVFLYELIWNLVGFLIVHLNYRKDRFDGMCFMIYAVGFGFGHALMAGLIAPEGNWNIAQIAALVLGLLALISLISNRVRSGKTTVTVKGDVAFTRNFIRYLSDEERAAKREADVACVTGMLEEMADQKYEEMTAAPVEEACDGEAAAEE